MTEVLFWLQVYATRDYCVSDALITLTPKNARELLKLRATFLEINQRHPGTIPYLTCLTSVVTYTRDNLIDPADVVGSYVQLPASYVYDGSEPERVDCEHAVVSSEGVFFEANVKNADAHFETHALPWLEIEKVAKQRRTPRPVWVLRYDGRIYPCVTVKAAHHMLYEEIHDSMEDYAFTFEDLSRLREAREREDGDEVLALWKKLAPETNPEILPCRMWRAKKKPPSF